MARLQIPLCIAVSAALASVLMGARSTPVSHGGEVNTLELKLALAGHNQNHPGVVTLTEDIPNESLVGIMEFAGSYTGEVNCSVNSSYVKTKPLGSPVYHSILLAECVDRESQSEITVKLDCWDQSKPVPARASRVFTVIVRDENDNDPIFSESIYLANVTEGAAVGEFVLIAKATDADAEINGQFSFSLSALDMYGVNPFAIDAETGRITTQLVLDREASANYTFNVVATDKGLPPNSASAVVIVYVEDVNDNAPEIVTKELRVRENQPGDTPVGRIVAADRDSGLNAEPVFSKVEGDDQSTAPFEVKPNGNVFTIVPLDREQKSEYTMTVTVKDKGSPRLSSTATLTIIVEDDNDNPPEITSSCLPLQDDPYALGYLASNETCAGLEGCITVDWYAPERERIIYQAKASDMDKGDNARLVYDIVTSTRGDNHTNDLFAIDRLTGALTLNRQLLPGDGLVHLINVTVSDMGRPARTAHCPLNITFDVDLSFLLLPAVPQQEMEIASTNSAETVTATRTWPHFGRIAVTSILTTTALILRCLS